MKKFYFLLVVCLPFTIAAEGGGCATPVTGALSYTTDIGTFTVAKTGKGVVFAADMGKRVENQK